MLMVGAGFMDTVHLKTAGRPASVKYAGVVDANESLARALGARHGLKWFNDPAAALTAFHWRNQSRHWNYARPRNVHAGTELL